MLDGTFLTPDDIHCDAEILVKEYIIELPFFEEPLLNRN